MRNGVGAQQRRRLAAWNQRGGDDNVSLLGALMHRLGLTLHPAGRHRAGVTTDAFGTFAFFIGFVGHVDELGAQRLDLLFYRRTHVGGFDHRTQALGRGNGLQPRNARTQNQYASGFDGTSGSHQHRHEAWIVVSGQQHRLVAGNVGLRRQHVEALRP
ncbi:hypothetical protein D3C77_215210 [compost metagenome]